jgi:hypothetical protein
MNSNSFNGSNMTWLSFELSVLRHLKFRSIALPLSGEPHLGQYLKRLGVRVSANDPAQWAWTKASAFIENNSDALTEEDVDAILADAYVPGTFFRNPALLSWFNETDAWWFDNVRANAERLSSPYKRALALAFGMAVADYVFSFNLETRDLRQPLSLTNVFRRLWRNSPAPLDNHQRNSSTNLGPRTFVAETYDTDALFLRLPHPPRATDSRSTRVNSWREDWVRQGKPAANRAPVAAGPSVAPVETKEQYLKSIEELLQIAGHLPTWAIAGISDGFVTADELIEAVGNARKIDAVYTKDFSELLGVKALMITATA